MAKKSHKISVKSKEEVEKEIDLLLELPDKFTPKDEYEIIAVKLNISLLERLKQESLTQQRSEGDIIVKALKIYLGNQYKLPL